jgi:hypothetical protein
MPLGMGWIQGRSRQPWTLRRLSVTAPISLTVSAQPHQRLGHDLLQLSDDRHQLLIQLGHALQLGFLGLGRQVGH